MSTQANPRQHYRKVNNDIVTPIQQVIGSLLCFVRTVDLTTLPGLGSIATEQSQATDQTKINVKHMLDYLATMSDAKIRYHKSNMVLNIHLDASYLSESRARSRVTG